MALTPSTMLPLGTLAPHFTLPDVISGQTISLTNIKSRTATVVMFICNHCPYVKFILPQLVDLTAEYSHRHINFVAINANDSVAYPDDAPEKMQELAKQWHFTFPYLFDESQTVAAAYQAACTPDFFVFDHELKCVYRGQFDDARPGNNITVTGNSLRGALDALIEGKNVNTEQKPSVGCNIKWKKAS